MSRPNVAVSIGCPSGIGPEIAVASAARSDARSILVGDIDVLRRAATLRDVSIDRLKIVETNSDVQTLEQGVIGVWGPSRRLGRLSAYGAPGREDGAAQLAWIDQALALVREGTADALVTGPVSKHAIATSGASGAEGFSGHTDYLAAQLGASEVVMAFRSAMITTALVTIHMPLSRVPEAITPEAVATSSYWIVRLFHALGRPSPRIAVAALNPHAGEQGLLGDEEITRIEPGIRVARTRLEADGYAATLEGPVGAETAFRKHVQGDYDGVVAMYHDQGTIPCKMVGFGKTVNVTLGLPIVRTSVDHGTGYDIAGTGAADPQAMDHAVVLAVELSRARGPARLTFPAGSRH